MDRRAPGGQVALLALGLVVLASLAAGCDDDSEGSDPSVDPTPGTGTLLGRLVSSETGDPVGSLEVSLLDLHTLANVDFTRADSTGAFVFDDVRPGDYLPVVHSVNRVLFGLPRTRFRFAAAETLRTTYPLARIEGLQQSELEMTGRVVDAETGEPIPFARLEMNSFGNGANAFESGPNWSEFRGSTTTLEPTADAEGRFRLGPVPIVRIYVAETNSVDELIASWRVTAPGYRAAGFDRRNASSFVPNPVVRLQRGRDEGAITGTVVGLDGEIRAGVQVHAEWRGAPGQFPRSPELARLMPAEPTAVSDSLGRFRLESLPPGRYVVEGGPMGDDGWVGILVSGVVLDVGQLEASAGALVAQPAIRLLFPGDLELVRGATPLRWEPFPGAVRYTVVLRRAVDQQSATASVQAAAVEPTPGTNLFDRPGLFRLQIIAFDEQGREISVTERGHLFFYDPEPGDES